MEKITSTSNEIVKNTAKLSQKKYRDERGLFIAEGEKSVRGLLNAEFKLDSLFLQKEFNIKTDKMYFVNDAVMAKISTTKTPCEILGVFRQKKYKKEDLLKQKKLLLLENIKDAGNLGTIMRACKAFDIDSIIMLGNTIDLYNPKVVRASVGCFDIPVISIDYPDLNLFKNYSIYSTSLHENSIPLKNVTFKEPFIIAFGSEADGLTDSFLTQKTININIEMNKNVESLNLASAVSICLYEIYKNN